MVHSAPLLVLLIVLATTRVTVLVVDDGITEPIRAAIAERVDSSTGRRRRAASWVEYLVNCPWCVSVWAGGVVAGVTYAWHDYWPVQVGLIALSASYVAGLLSVVRDRLEG